MPRVTVITFAGRRDRMCVLARTMLTALSRGIIDEWHVWNYARTLEDSAWVDSLPSHLEDSRVVVRTPTQVDTYADAYMAYAPEDYADDDVFVKIDDDILYIDLNGLEHLIQFRKLNPHYYIVSANVINNLTCYLLQRQLGVWPDDGAPDPDRLLATGSDATTLHRTFLQGHDPMFMSVAEIDPKYIININFVTWLGRDLESVRYCESTTATRDEQNLGNAFPRIFNRPMCVFGPCVAAHLSHHNQDADMPIAELIDAYARFHPTSTMDPLVVADPA